MGGLWVHNASQHVNDVSQYPTILAVCVCLTIWMLIIVGLRVYVRGHMIKSFGADDWTILFSAVSNIGRLSGRTLADTMRFRSAVSSTMDWPLDNRGGVWAFQSRCARRSI